MGTICACLSLNLLHFSCTILTEVKSMSKFSSRLRELRINSGYSQAALSKKIGISKSSVNMYERDEREPGIETIEAIADVFNVDLDYLLGKSDVKNRFPITDFINKI